MIYYKLILIIFYLIRLVLSSKNIVLLLFACAYRLRTEYAALTICLRRHFLPVKTVSTKANNKIFKPQSAHTQTAQRSKSQ